ncbi:hypothetical protein HU200_067690 [Digitaria exilis]|uniref:Uncharacterized protein n=1 Tax=Digitaria exilis TaxID=1010633 RepID=A0A835DS18_9POAL|nr:hypothetical protein HU200_067690 [Digitaria exilis]
MPWNLTSSSLEYSNALTNLGLSVMEKPSRLPSHSPSFNVGAGASSSTLWRGAHGDFFSEADMEAINKDKILKKIVSTDPQRVKRILYNRATTADLNAQNSEMQFKMQMLNEQASLNEGQELNSMLSERQDPPYREIHRKLLERCKKLRPASTC